MTALLRSKCGERWHSSISAVVLLIVCGLGHAQELPPTIRIVVPFAAGGAVDGSARVLADSLQRVAGRTVIVENKPGASGFIGTAEVARARPDGATLLLVTGGYTAAPALYAKLPYDSLRDFAPVTQLVSWPGFVLLVSPSSPYQKLSDVIEAARAKPGTLSYGSSGLGNTTHLVGALFAREAGIDMIHVPYKGSAPIVTDILGGQITMTFGSGNVAKPYVDSGRLRALAISGGERTPQLPDVPSLGELGYQAADVPAWIGLLAPAKTPEPTLRRLYQAIQTAAQSPDFVNDSARQGAKLVVSTPTQFGSYLDSEMRRYQRQLPPLGIRME